MGLPSPYKSLKYGVDVRTAAFLLFCPILFHLMSAFGMTLRHSDVRQIWLLLCFKQKWFLTGTLICLLNLIFCMSSVMWRRKLKRISVWTSNISHIAMWVTSKSTRNVSIRVWDLRPICVHRISKFFFRENDRMKGADVIAVATFQTNEQRDSLYT